MTLLRRLLPTPPREARSISYQDVWGSGGDWAGGRWSDAGVNVTTDMALRCSAVYACVRLIAETVASLNIDTYVADAQLRALYRPRPAWLDQPNSEMTLFGYWERVMASLLLEGNAYSWVGRDRFGVVDQAWPLDPRAVEPQREKPGGPVTYRVCDPDRDILGVYGPDEILHVAAFGHRGLKGLSPITYASQSIGLALAAEEFGARFYGQGANPSGVIETDGALTADQASRTARSFVAANSGRSNAHLPAVLEGGAHWKQLTINPVDAQALQSRQWQVVDIARVFRVPPHKIGEIVDHASQGGGAGLESQNIQYAQDTITPWLERTEAAYSQQRYLPGEAVYRFDTDSIVRGDSVTRAQVHLVYRNAGVLNPDEIRGELGRGPVPGGDQYDKPLNMGPIGAAPDAGNPPARSWQTVRDRFGRLAGLEPAGSNGDGAGG